MLRLGSVLGRRQLAGNGAAATRTTKREMCGLLAAIDDVWTQRGGAAHDPNVPLLSDADSLRNTTKILYHRCPDGYQVSSGTVGN